MRGWSARGGSAARQGTDGGADSGERRYRVARPAGAGALTVLTLAFAVTASAHAQSTAGPRLAVPATTGSVTRITINGARPGPVFDGVGAISGGGGTARLLIDYPKPQRQQILDYLFKPGYGADVQMLKLEIGGDAEASDGSEPSFEHTKGHINCNAGYEIWLAEQAKKLNPRIKFYALQWSAPGWVGDGKQDPWTQTDISYLMSWMHCAKTLGLTVNYLGGWNEHLPSGPLPASIRQWYVDLRAALNRNGYRKTLIVAADEDRRTPDLSSYLSSDPAFGRAIGVLGYHDLCQYPTTGLKCVSPATARASGKPIWASEIGDLIPPGGTAALARTLDNAFIQARITGILEYPLITSMPAAMPEEELGLVLASQPWSGSYQVSPEVWVLAQTTQFTHPGWVYVDGADGSLKSGGSYVSYEGPGRKAWSMVAQTTTASKAQQVTVHVAGLPASVVHVWATDVTPSSTTFFVRQPDIHPKAGTFTATLNPGYIYSFTTTTGQGHGKPGAPPAAAAMPLPYTTTPITGEPYGPDSSNEPWGLEPVDGAFEYAKGVSSYFEQTASGRPDFWQKLFPLARFPYALVGDYCLADMGITGGAAPSYCDPDPEANYTVSTTVTFTKPNQSAGVIARYYRPILAPIQYFQGYRFVVSEDGKWQLLRDTFDKSAKTLPVTLASGSYTTTSLTSGPHVISLTADGSQLTASIDGNQVSQVTDGTYSTGVAGICTGGWYAVKFDNVTVSAAG
jgi:hypothetical protein